MSNDNSYEKIVPIIGMGATICYWSDREPATVVRVSESGKTIFLQEDSYIRTDNNGTSEDQSYIYNLNPNGRVHCATLRKDGSYKLTKSKTQIVLGSRRKYYDYSF